ncbi:hypothetical protein J7I94_19430 [Streptomyces sp. ISL-12]|uniref:hypothetical protein n=1 Tax=Streptomyces sp. ISL-12 TaxID=2819177 RepID=UPI001BE9270D|nr:hypothetical protein [Streptomyces sp. ISL-12]MBT2412706.1 hypothetical protein [Streptomyces sp. ISL-12]
MLEIEGRGRVAVWPLLHDWQTSARCVLAYTTTGHFGDTAVMGVIPVEGNEAEPGDLFAMAGRHDPGRLYTAMTPDEQRACWLACSGFSARLLGAPKGFEVTTEWKLDMARTVTLSRGTMYGHGRVTAGRMRIVDNEIHARAVALLKSAVEVP